MDLSSLTVRVQASRLLTAAEKMYWLRHLPRMTEPQIAKLDSILAQGEALPWSDAIPNYQTAQTLIPTTA